MHIREVDEGYMGTLHFLHVLSVSLKFSQKLRIPLKMYAECLVHIKSSTNGRQFISRQVSFNLRWKGLIISHQAKRTETCFWEKFLCVNSEVNSTRASRVASKGSLL